MDVHAAPVARLGRRRVGPASPGTDWPASTSCGIFGYMLGPPPSVQAAASRPGSSRALPRPSAAACRTAKQHVRRVGLKRFRVALRDLVGLRHHDQLVQPLQLPAAFPRTRWRASRATPGASAGRRTCRSRSTSATMPRPKWYCQRRFTIHAGGQRVVLRRDPVRRARCAGRWSCVLRGPGMLGPAIAETAGTRAQPSLGVRIAADQNVRFRGTDRAVVHRQREFLRRRVGFLIQSLARTCSRILLGLSPGQEPGTFSIDRGRPSPRRRAGPRPASS